MSSDRLTPPGRLTRRLFLKGAAAGATLVATPLGGCGNQVRAAPAVEADLIVDTTSPRYGQIQVRLFEVPDLLPVGGAVTVLVRNPPEDLPLPRGGVLLIHRGAPEDPPEFVATESACTHEACPLGYSPSTKQIECPCHSSTFRAAPDPAVPGSAIGDVLHLPATGALTSFPIEMEGDVLYIDVLANPLPAPEGGVVVLPLADFPELSQVGGAVVGLPRGFADVLAIVRSGPNQVAATSAVCTHMRCTLSFATDANRLRCPCHGSEFELTGQVVNPPAMDPLRAYPAVLETDRVVITVS